MTENCSLENPLEDVGPALENRVPRSYVAGGLCLHSASPMRSGTRPGNVYFFKKELENPPQDENAYKCDHFFLMANQGPEQNESTLVLVVKTHKSLIRLLEETTDGNRLTCPATKVKNALFL